MAKRFTSIRRKSPPSLVPSRVPAGSKDVQADSITVIDFSLTDYTTIYNDQKRLVRERLEDVTRPDVLLVGEHPHVITTGRGTKPENIQSPQCPVIEIERGGDVTYHGPGQLIAYPIHYLQEGKRDLHQYLRNLESIIITTLAGFEIEGFRLEGFTGVWVLDGSGDKKKIASIGVAVKKWVTYHGIALNVATDLAYFQPINPCGLKSQIMTTMSELLKGPVSVSEVKPKLIKAYQQFLAVL